MFSTSPRGEPYTRRMGGAPAQLRVSGGLPEVALFPSLVSGCGDHRESSGSLSCLSGTELSFYSSRPARAIPIDYIILCVFVTSF